MYHQVLPSAPPVGPQGYFAVSREQFGQQLAVLSAAGYRGVSLEEAAAANSERAVGITFDDGDWTSYAVAFPELAARRMAATFFVITSRIGTPGFATWQELREMRRAGMSIQSHTHSHPFLSTLEPADVASELIESKRLLDTMLEQETVGVSLPNGDHPRAGALAAARSAGYRWVATSRWGPNHGDTRDSLVRRYTIRRATTSEAFAALVRRQPPAWSSQGLRLVVLEQIRGILGVARYARWRRKAMHLLG
jgi:peptidoglycan/xylan/chitin deacetylase (PgdA/CDA1 family)